MGRRVLLLALTLVAAAPVADAAAARPSGEGIVVDGRRYVELAAVSRRLSGTFAPARDGIRAHLTVAGRVVTVTRNWAQVLIDGDPLVLDAPARVRGGVWLVPASFVGRVQPRLVPRTPARPAPAPSAALPSPAPVAPPPRATLEDLRARTYPAFTRVVVETSSPVPARVETLAGEIRIGVDGLDAAPRAERVDDGFVTAVTLERGAGRALLRVGFAGEPVLPRVTSLEDPPRLVLDFHRPAGARPGAPAEPIRTLVLDAGHGGHDPGAVGPTGLAEKDLVLDVTRRLARLAEARLGVRVVLTRDADVFVPLPERTRIANRERADLFVSIHANAHREPAVAGIETFFLSSEATDGHARQVAARENGVVQRERGPGRGADAVRAMLWDLAQSEFQEESERLAEAVQDALVRAERTPDRGVKQAGFYVLGGAAMPAVLVEIGFVTNAREERHLRDDAARDRIAAAILRGLAEYQGAHEARRPPAAGTARAR